MNFKEFRKKYQGKMFLRENDNIISFLKFIKVVEEDDNSFVCIIEYTIVFKEDNQTFASIEYMSFHRDEEICNMGFKKISKPEYNALCDKYVKQRVNVT